MITTHSQAKYRRGLTLVEMLVVVALTVLMMTIIAQIFQATTGAIQIARAYQEIDQELRAIEGTIKRDLAGTTATMTPPLNPKDDLGYFEYGENEFADAQGEDSDDYLAFTTKSNDGNLFYGRHLPPLKSASIINGGLTGPNTTNYSGTAPAIQTITSDKAEVIYFLRNGNLYRRVFLVKPTIKLSHEWAFDANGFYTGVNPTNLNLTGIDSNYKLGWQALNDISSRPCEYVINRNGLNSPNFPVVFDTYNNGVLVYQSEMRPIANSLGDLTNRENRAFKPRFSNDYFGPASIPDGIPDDFVGGVDSTGLIPISNNINDLNSSSYPKQMNNLAVVQGSYLLNLNEALPNASILSIYGSYDKTAFPFIYPHAFSRTANNYIPYTSDPSSANSPILPQGFIHGIAFEKSNLGKSRNYSPNGVFEAYWNHNPLEAEDNLYTPDNDPYGNSISQTWWGFPTWREQLSPFWIDPIKRVNAAITFTSGPNFNPNPNPLRSGLQAFGLSWDPDIQPLGWLPSMGLASDPAGFPVRIRPQTFSEELNSNANSQAAGQYSVFLNSLPFWDKLWEDDLIATNVRSFDVKAYEPLVGVQTYVDLGYNATITGGASIVPTAFNPMDPSNTTTFTNWLQGFGHEGRIPPLTTDFRLDAQYPFIPGVGLRYLGDDDAGVIRLRRVWDSWSTDYSAVDAKTIDPLTAPPFQTAPRPSYPAPYPAPLRGIQIQIRMTDPRQERVRTITIHQDFTSKL